MATRVLEVDGQRLCLPCSGKALSDGLVMTPVGVIHNELVAGKAAPRQQSAAPKIVIYEEYAEALDGLSVGDDLDILFHFGRSPRKTPLRQHPQDDENQPLRGVFALRSPRRPNRIGLSTVHVLSVEANELTVSGLDAWDGTLVLDIKPQ